MNRRMVLNTIGHIAVTESALMLLPLFISLLYGEKAVWSFAVSASVALVLGLLLRFFSKPSTRVIYAKEGFAIVAFAWLLMSLLGALPFYLSGSIPSFVDAIFETVSGFTTTGASILTEIESLPKGILFWRSFTHWVGGMGVLVFVMALVPNVADRSMNIMRAEMPGPTVGKLLPKARDTAKILYIIYVVMTLVEIILLLFGGMSLFESVVHAFGTAGTGGFGIKNDSIASYSAYLQWIITVFMLLFSVNFNLYYLLLTKKFKSVLKSSELLFFGGFVLISVIVISVNVYSIYGTLSDTLRHTSFQVSSIVSTTGYATVDFNQWPELSKSIILLLMVVGGCAGSTAGGLKVSRVIILLKSIYREIKRLLHPRSVRTVNMELKRVDEQTLNGVYSYFAIYIVIIIGLYVIISIESVFDMQTNFSAVLACFNNVGPGLGAVGPTSNYAVYSDFSKIVLSLAMLLGRLEIFPLLLGLNPLMWKKK